MDKETVRMLAGVAAEIARRVAIEVRLAGMVAENERRAINGDAPAYDESDFNGLVYDAETIATRLGLY